MNNCTRNKTGEITHSPFISVLGKPLPITHYLLPIPHSPFGSAGFDFAQPPFHFPLSTFNFQLSILLLFFSTLAFGQGGQMKVAGNIATDTVKANKLIKHNAAIGEVLLANGSVVPSSTTAGMVLTSNANGTPTWQNASAAASGTGPSFTQAATAGSAGTQNGLGLGTSTPNSLFTVDGTGYANNKVFNISSNNDVMGILNSVDSANVGLNVAINNDPQWFVGLQPVNNTPHHLIFKSTHYTNDETPSPLKLGVNRNDPYFNVDIEGSLKGKGYRYNIRKFSPASGVATDINLDWSDDYLLIYPTGSDLSNITVNFTTLPEYNEWFPLDQDWIWFDDRKLNFTSKRVVVKIIGNGTVTNNNFIKLNFQTSPNSSIFHDGINSFNSAKTLNATYNQTYTFVLTRQQFADITWSLENQESL